MCLAQLAPRYLQLLFFRVGAKNGLKKLDVTWMCSSLMMAWISQSDLEDCRSVLLNTMYTATVSRDGCEQGDQIWRFVAYWMIRYLQVQGQTFVSEPVPKGSF
jgi:hypothetical protein